LQQRITLLVVLDVCCIVVCCMLYVVCCMLYVVLLYVVFFIYSFLRYYRTSDDNIYYYTEGQKFDSLPCRRNSGKLRNKEKKWNVFWKQLPKKEKQKPRMQCNNYLPTSFFVVEEERHHRPRSMRAFFVFLLCSFHWSRCC
jgi:hypothetical protein